MAIFSLGNERVYRNGTGRLSIIIVAPVADSFTAQIGVTVGEAENPRKTIPIGGSRPVREYKYANKYQISH